jgi:hypothetical protein
MLRRLCGYRYVPVPTNLLTIGARSSPSEGES